MHTAPRMIAALYVDALGPYPSIPGVDAWDAQRDARRYDGPHPVVAHPPCAGYSLFRHLARVDEERDELAIIAIAQVRKWGGVLEHPAHSRLWHRRLDLPRPGELPDEYGGRTIAVNQLAWGHGCRKATWLYLVRVPEATVVIRTGGKATHVIGGGGDHYRGDQTLLVASKQMANRSPPLFAQWLVAMARAVTP